MYDALVQYIPPSFDSQRMTVSWVFDIFFSFQKWVCRLDLEGGTYALLPYTSGCQLKPSDDERNGADQGEVPLTDEKEGRIVLTPNCM